MNIYDWFIKTQSVRRIGEGADAYDFQDVRPVLKCKDGTTLSVQASVHHYSTPRSITIPDGGYTEVEVWCLKGEVTPALAEYGDGDDPWAYVPIGVIIDLINAHGGIADDTPLRAEHK